MADPMAPWLLVGLTFTELLLLVAVLVFFRRLKRSEALLEQLQQKQEQFVAKLAFSAELEQELVASFEQRQQELLELEKRLSQRRDELERLLASSGQAPLTQKRQSSQPKRQQSPPPAQRHKTVREPKTRREEPVLLEDSQPTARQIVLGGHKRGLSPRTLAQASGLTLDEVELILLDAKRSRRG